MTGIVNKVYCSLDNKRVTLHADVLITQCSPAIERVTNPK